MSYNFLNKKNNAITTISGNLTVIATSVTIDDVSVFPAVPFHATIWDGDLPRLDDNMEIVKVTAINGSVLTIERAKEDTSAVAHTSGQNIALLITSELLEEITTQFNAHIDDFNNPHQTSTSGGTWGSITGTLSDQTDLQDALDLKYNASNPAGYISSESDPVFTAWLSTPPNISIFNNDSGYLTETTADDIYYRQDSFSILDEDDMASDSATDVASQQSIKAYVDALDADYLQLDCANDANFDIGTDSLILHKNTGTDFATWDYAGDFDGGNYGTFANSEMYKVELQVGNKSEFVSSDIGSLFGFDPGLVYVAFNYITLAPELDGFPPSRASTATGGFGVRQINSAGLSGYSQIASFGTDGLVLGGENDLYDGYPGSDLIIWGDASDHTAFKIDSNDNYNITIGSSGLATTPNLSFINNAGDTTFSVEGSSGNTVIAGTTTLATSLNGLAKLTNGLVSAITDNSSNWDTAYGWGNHASAGYFIKVSDTTNDITDTTTNRFVTDIQIGNWDNAYILSHTHSNKANLDTINQNLSTTSSPYFSNITSGKVGTIASILGNTNTFTGVAGDKIKVTINGFDYDDIDISGATTIAEVATAICSAVTDWEEVASAAGGTGYLYIRSRYSGTDSSVSITDGTGGNGGETLRLFASNPTSGTGTYGVGVHSLYGTKLSLGDGIPQYLGILELVNNLDPGEIGAYMYLGTHGTGDGPTGLQVILDKGYTGAGFSRAMWFRNKTQGTGNNAGLTGSTDGICSGNNIGVEGLARNSTTDYRNIAVWAHGGLFKASEDINSDPIYLATDSNAGDGYFHRDLEVASTIHSTITNIYNSISCFESADSYGKLKKYTANKSLQLTNQVIQDAGDPVALEFDGMGDKVTFNDQSDFDLTGDWTIGFWIYSDGASSDEYIISKHSAGVGTGWRLILNRDEKIKLELWTGTTATSAASITTGAWNYVVVRYTDSTSDYDVFINNSVENFTRSFSMIANTTPLVVGNIYNYSFGWFDGVLDEMSVWNRSLTDAEVSDLWNSGNGIFMSPSEDFPSTGTAYGDDMAILLHLSDDVLDSSGNGYNGTITGTPAYVMGKVEEGNTLQEVTVLDSVSGTQDNEYGITYFGDDNARTIIRGTKTEITGGQISNMTEVITATYTVLATDHHISIQYTSTGTQITTLPAISATNHKQEYEIKDADYNASVNNITIATTGADTIEGQASGTMNNDGEAWTVVANNTTKNWEVY